MIATDPSSPLTSLALELQRQLETKRDLIADTRSVSLSLADPNPEFPGEWDETVAVGDATQIRLNVDLRDGAEQFGLTRLAQQQLAEHVNVPWKLAERLTGKHPDLYAHLANGLLFREVATRTIRTLDGNARAFLSDRYRPRDNWDLMEQAVLPALHDHPGDVRFRRCDLTDTKMYVKVSLPEFELRVTPRRGDVIHGGLVIQNSEVGAGALLIAPYTVVLDCTNGMVHTEYGQRQIHVGKRVQAEEAAFEFYSDETIRLDDAAFFAKCRDTIKAVLNKTVFDAIVGQMRDLAGLAIETPPQETIEVLAKDNGFTDGESASMMRALIEGHDLSSWGYLNAITQTARDLEDPDRQTELETVAGRLLNDREAWEALAA